MSLLSRCSLLVMLVMLVMLVSLVASAGAQEADDPSARAALVLAVSAAGEADAGGTPIGGVHEATVRRGQRRRFPVAIPAGGCVLVVAQARGVAKLAVALTAGRRTLARAESEGGGPAQAVHCNEGRALRGRLEVRSLSGAGPFAAGAYRVSAEAAAPSGATAHEGLDALEARHAGRGYVAASPVGNERLVDEGRVERSVALVGGSCYRILAAGGPGVRDLALELREPGGRRAARHTGDGPTATLGVLRPLCPTRSGRFVLALGVAGGGDVAWQIFRAAAAERAAAAAAARPRPPVGGSGTGFVARALRTRHGQVGEGMVPLLPAEQGTLQRSESKLFPFEARPGHCYRVIAVGMPSIRALQVRILDAYGSERAASVAEPQPSARFCPAAGGRYRAELKAANGYGGFALQIFESR